MRGERAATRAGSPLARALVAIGILAVGLLASVQGRAADAPPPGITREQARELLDTLNDPAKREQFTRTLQAYLDTLPASTTTTGPGAPPVRAASAAAAASGRKVRGPDFLKRAFARIQTAGAQLSLELRSLTNGPALQAWLGSRLQIPGERAAVLRGSLLIGLIFALAAVVEILVRRYLSHRLAPSTATREPAMPGPTDRRLAPRRVAARLTAVIAALILGNAGVLFIADPVSRIAAFAAVNTYLALRVVLGALDGLIRTETEPAGATAAGMSGRVRFLLTALFIVIAAQWTTAEVTEELGTPAFIQDALAKCTALVAHVLGIVLVLASRRAVSAWIRDRGRAARHGASLADAVAAIWPWVAVCAIAGSWLVLALDIPDAYEHVIRLTVTTAVVLLASRFIGNLLMAVFDRRMSALATAPAGTFGARLIGYRRAMRLMLKVLLVVATLLALTEAWGLPSLRWLGEGHPGHRLGAFVVQLLVLGVVGILCWEGADLAFERRVNSLMQAASQSRATRLRTLQPIVRFALLILIGLLVVMTALDAIGINVGPLLAGASIVGVALGFGSQKLVQDFITGIFLLVEDAMDVGDWVTLAGVSGTVEHISIRSIRLRAADGSVYLVPFSSVTSVNNTNRGVGNASVSVSIDPCEDTDRVSALLVDIAKEMRADPQYRAAMQSDLQLWGVDKVDGSAVTIAGQIVCTDAGRWAVQREFNRRMKLRLQQEHVLLATPHQSLRITAEADVSDPSRWRRSAATDQVAPTR